MENQAATGSKWKIFCGQKPEPEVEGETRVRVAICSRKWFGVEARLNGQTPLIRMDTVEDTTSPGLRDGEKIQGCLIHY